MKQLLKIAFLAALFFDHLAFTMTRAPAGDGRLIAAAKNGDLAYVKDLVEKKHANVNFHSEQTGLSPLAWAIIYDHPDIVEYLVGKGADIHAADNTQSTILHKAAAAGNKKTIEFLLKNNASKDINRPNNKGRTPLMEAMRVQKDGLIHVGLEDSDAANAQQFGPEFTKAIQELRDKEKKRLDTDRLLEVVVLLKRYGANATITDAEGKRVDFYINNVSIASEPDRIALLKALGLPVAENKIQFTIKDLPRATGILNELKDLAARNGFEKKVAMAIWGIQEAQRRTGIDQIDALRVVMALMAKIKEIAKEKLQNDPPLFKYLENQVDSARAIVRDAILRLKFPLAQQSMPLPPLSPAAKTAAPSPAARRLPALSPSAAQTTQMGKLSTQEDLDVNLVNIFNESSAVAIIDCYYPQNGTLQKFTDKIAPRDSYFFMYQGGFTVSKPAVMTTLAGKFIVEVGPDKKEIDARKNGQIINRVRYNRDINLRIDEAGNVTVVPKK